MPHIKEVAILNLIIEILKVSKEKNFSYNLIWKFSFHDFVLKTMRNESEKTQNIYPSLIIFLEFTNWTFLVNQENFRFLPFRKEKFWLEKLWNVFQLEALK